MAPAKRGQSFGSGGIHGEERGEPGDIEDALHLPFGAKNDDLAVATLGLFQSRKENAQTGAANVLQLGQIERQLVVPPANEPQNRILGHRAGAHVQAAAQLQRQGRTLRNFDNFHTLSRHWPNPRAVSRRRMASSVY